MKSDLRVIKGVNIAVIILSGIGLLGAVISAIVSVVGHGYLYSPEFQSLLYSLFEEDFDPGTSGLTSDDAANMTTLLSSVTIVIFIVMSILGVIVKGVLIAAGYFGLKTASEPSCAKSSFVWAIVGAVLAGFCGSFVSMVLFIVSAVYLNKLRRTDEPSAFTGSTAPYYSVPYQQVPYQPLYNNPPVYPQAAGYATAVPQQPGLASVQPAQSVPVQPVSVQPASSTSTPVQPQSVPEPVAPSTEPAAAQSSQPIEQADGQKDRSSFKE